jgi:hypothetical protein
MYNIRANDGDVSHGIKEFVCDAVEDLATLPQCKIGSTAFVIATSEIYMINSKGEWVKL